MTYAKYIVLIFLLFTGYAVRAQIINTIAGNGRFGFGGDGAPATDAQLYGCMGMAVDDSGSLYIADVINNRVRKIDRMGIITTVAGSGDVAVAGSGSYGGDGGPATDAGLYWPEGIVTDHHGNLLIADAVNNRIRMVNTAGVITTIAGSDSAGFSGDGGPATAARLRYSSDVAVDRYNNIYIADGFNNRIRKVDTNGIITTVAGNGIYAAADSGDYSGDGGPATAAALYRPQSVTLDTNGNIFIADMLNNRIRKVSTGGIITTVAGNGFMGYGGDGPATSTMMINPSGVALDRGGNLYIADGGSNRIRMVSPAGIMTTVAGTGRGGYSGDGGIDTAADLFSPSGVTLDRAGNIYITDAANYRIRMISPIATGIDRIIAPIGISIYPNPSSSSFTLNIATACDTDVHVYITNMTGQTMKELQAPANKDITVQLHVPVGIYTINACTDGGTVVRKIVIAQ